MSAEIPIQNLYYLLCYAWDQLAEGEVVDIAADDSKSLTELFARILTQGTQRLMKRGFDRGYLPEVEETPRLRGKLDISASMKRLSWREGRMVCEFDELSHNVLHNRILKTTLEDLWHAEGIGSEVRDLIHRQLEAMRGIERVAITSGLFGRVHLHRNNRFYRFLLNVCELLHDSKLPEPRAGPNRFQAFVRDPKLMPAVFESFVKNFYHRKQAEFSVGRAQFRWAATAPEASLAVLPVMKTDVSLWSAQRRIILDCKFYREAMTGWLGTAKVHAGNLYQIYAYIRNADQYEKWKGSEGILLYPAVRTSFDHSFEIEGHRVRIASVDLDQPWQMIHTRLLDVIAFPQKLRSGCEVGEQFPRPSPI